MVLSSAGPDQAQGPVVLRATTTRASDVHDHVEPAARPVATTTLPRPRTPPDPRELLDATSSRTPAGHCHRPRRLIGRGLTRRAAGLPARPHVGRRHRRRPDPKPTCTPAAGPSCSVVGTTTIACSVDRFRSARRHRPLRCDRRRHDGTELASDVPSDIVATTSDPGGRAVTFSTPTRDDSSTLAAASAATRPAAPSSPVGTTGDLHGTDASGNHASTGLPCRRRSATSPPPRHLLSGSSRSRARIDLRGQPRPDRPDQGAAARRRHDGDSRGRPPAPSCRAADGTVDRVATEPGAVAAGTSRSTRRRSPPLLHRHGLDQRRSSPGRSRWSSATGESVKSSPKRRCHGTGDRVERPPLEDEHEAALTTSKQGLP